MWACLRQCSVQAFLCALVNPVYAVSHKQIGLQQLPKLCLVSLVVYYAPLYPGQQRRWFRQQLQYCVIQSTLELFEFVGGGGSKGIKLYECNRTIVAMFKHSFKVGIFNR